MDIQSLSDSERFNLAKQLASDIREALPKALEAKAFSIESKLTYKVGPFRELLIHRVSDLSDVALDLFEGKQVIAAFIITRAIVETTALTYWLYFKAQEFLQKKDEQAFDEFLMKGLMGSRDGSTNYDSHNVLTAIDRLDREFQGLRRMYDGLCEFTHPNWRGVMGSYAALDRERLLLLLGKERNPPSIDLGLAPLIGALSIFQHYYNELAPIVLSINDIYDS